MLGHLLLHKTESYVFSFRNLRTKIAVLGWLVESARAAGGGVLGACDTAGEKLAWWFGITSPKYYYEIQEALRMKGNLHSLLICIHSVNWKTIVTPFLVRSAFK